MPTVGDVDDLNAGYGRSGGGTIVQPHGSPPGMLTWQGPNLCCGWNIGPVLHERHRGLLIRSCGLTRLLVVGHRMARHSAPLLDPT